MTETKSRGLAVIIQTVILVATLIGIALTQDRRVTVVEDKLIAEVEMRKTINRQQAVLIDKLQANEQELIKNQSRVVTLLEVIDKRHALEDVRRR